ncbi:unnamed protein product [Aureobasidium vineae]|uniref:Large ribosomal subunit protein P1 n=1 Tax=Aureobasidium vineae TaxID=2773715 RepID=A0A9N8JWV9_9PEZI|nr:unnamed protein product [Aureobasidium vineae]
MSTAELASSYAALILADEGIEITADKLSTIISAAKLEVEPIWTQLFAKALEGKDVKELLLNVGSGSGAAAAPAAGASAGGAAAEDAPPRRRPRRRRSLTTTWASVSSTKRLVPSSLHPHLQKYLLRVSSSVVESLRLLGTVYGSGGSCTSLLLLVGSPARLFFCSPFL